MSNIARRAWTVGLVAAMAVAASAVLARWGADANAAMMTGSEEVFAEGLHEREIPPRGLPLRWTHERARLQFWHLPPGAARLDLDLVGHRGPVRIAAGGMVVAELAAGETTVSREVPVPESGRVTIEIAAQGFRAGDGRVLGTQLRRVALHGRPAWYVPGLLWILLLPVLVWTTAAWAVGAREWLAAAFGAGAAVVFTAATWPSGAFRSAYASEVAWTMVAGALAGVGVARMVSRRDGRRTPWPLVVSVAATALLLVPATSPLMVASDVTFQAHMLDRVTHGEWFPTSVTQHAHAFRIPYGVSFFALLAPLRSMGWDAVHLVRWGSALAAFGSVLGLFVGLRDRGERRSALGSVLLLLIPGTFIVFSQGNLPNAFGQAMTVLFFAWWAGCGRRWWVGAALGAMGGLAHLSSAIVLAALCVFLAADLSRLDRMRRRPRLVAAAVVGLAMACYYGAFVPLIVRQLPRMLEGRGASGAGSSLLEALSQQATQSVVWWGWGGILLAGVGMLPALRGAGGRFLAAFWLTGGVLCAAALLTPLEVRYLYALTLPVALTAAVGLRAMWGWGQWGRIAGTCTLAAQVALAVSGIVDRVLHAYR